MTADLLDENEWRSRFALIEIDGDGVLLDHRSGAIYRLNRTSYGIWAAFVAGESIGAISRLLMTRFGIDRDRAERDTIATLRKLPEVALERPPEQFRWGVTPSGYAFFKDENLVCEVDARGETLSLRPEFCSTQTEACAYLKAVAPKLLALRGVFTLHASAVEIAGSLLVLSGRSGAGKTTTARAFEQCGAHLVSEDLLVLTPDLATPEAVGPGESAIRRWVNDQGRQAVRTGTQIDCKRLDDCFLGARRPIARILLIDAQRRSGNQIQVEELTRPDALVTLIESLYFASADAGMWRASFEVLRMIVSKVPVGRATIPASLPALQSAVASYREAGPR